MKTPRVKAGTAAAPGTLEHQRADLVARLRVARATLSPKAAVGAAENSPGGTEHAVQLRSSIAEAERNRPVPVGFQPRSVTMRVLMEHPDIALKVAATLLTLVFGRQLASRFGGASRLLSGARSVLAALL